MKVIHGDLLQLANDGEFDVIIHGCNCFCTMGAGIAKSIKQRYPQAFVVDQTTTIPGDKSKLGTYTVATIETKTRAMTRWTKKRSATGNDATLHTFQIVNAYTQYHWKSGRSGGRSHGSGGNANNQNHTGAVTTTTTTPTAGPAVDYDAIRQVFTIIRTDFHGYRIGYPKIGAGMAGGDWNIISDIINQALEGEDHTLVEYDNSNDNDRRDHRRHGRGRGRGPNTNNNKR
jgi:O-acetyl-ADP-ribose deacetylase (regulator of RNase III)